MQLLHDELQRLTDENARLRLEAQRPLHLLTVAETVRTAAQSVEDVAEQADESRQLLVEVLTLRTALLAVLRDLHTASGQMERRLELGVPATEIDRRVRERSVPEQLARGADSVVDLGQARARGLG